MSLCLLLCSYTHAIFYDSFQDGFSMVIINTLDDVCFTCAVLRDTTVRNSATEAYSLCSGYATALAWFAFFIHFISLSIAAGCFCGFARHAFVKIHPNLSKATVHWRVH